MREKSKLDYLYEELEKTKKIKLSLRKTTREHYNFIILLIKYYENEIARFEKKQQLIA